MASEYEGGFFAIVKTEFEDEPNDVDPTPVAQEAERSESAQIGDQPSTGNTFDRVSTRKGDHLSTQNGFERSSTRDQISTQTDFDRISTGGDQVAALNAKAAATTIIPAPLHEHYCQAASLQNQRSEFVCALCSKPLKCRSARDMRDHALSHGGAHWASAFRCLLCSYHSHSRRSVSKHVTTAHLIPDGVQCSPAELMENETITRQDELMALIRDCFPIQMQARASQLASGTRTTPFETVPVALPVGTEDPKTAFPVDQSYVGKIEQDVEPAFDVVEIDEEDYEDGAESVGWTANAPGHFNESDVPASSSSRIDGWPNVGEVRNPNVPQLQRGRNFGSVYHSYQASASQNNVPTSNAPLLESLLRDFQFHPSASMAEPAVTATRVGPIPSQLEDDPRALINRLLNVVAPDVARFLLEEAIRDRASGYQISSYQANRVVEPAPRSDTIMGTASVRLGGILTGMQTAAVRARPSAIMKQAASMGPIVPQPTAMDGREGQSALEARREDRLGKLGAFKCPECSVVFKRRRYLDRHIRARHRMHCYRCTMPGCSFTNARELWYVRRHHAKHHANETKLICRFCLTRFESSDELASRNHKCCSARNTAADTVNVAEQLNESG